MKDKVMDALQRFSKAMFIPVLILPIAGILIAVGNLFTNVRLQAVLPFLNNPVTIGFGTLLSGSLNAILGNLGVIFCVGLSVGLANKKKSEAGFISLLAFLVFLNAMNKFMNMRGMLVEGSLSGTGQAMVLGVQVLDMGVFIGLLLGIVVAYIHNRFCETEFNNAFQIYGGTRFVFIVLIPVMVVLAVLFTFVWPYAQAGINALGGFIRSAGNFGLFIYGTLERLLIPTGLHHLVYTPFLYTSLGGTATVGGQVLEGARNIYYAEIADPSVAVLSQSVIWDARGISKMFGLIGACLAMYQNIGRHLLHKVGRIVHAQLVHHGLQLGIGQAVDQLLLGGRGQLGEYIRRQVLGAQTEQHRELFGRQVLEHGGQVGSRQGLHHIPQALVFFGVIQIRQHGLEGIDRNFRHKKAASFFTRRQRTLSFPGKANTPCVLTHSRAVLRHAKRLPSGSLIGDINCRCFQQVP